MNSKKVANFCLLIDLDLTLNACFNVTQIFKRLFLNIMLKRIDTKSRFQIIGRLFQVLVHRISHGFLVLFFGTVALMFCCKNTYLDHFQQQDRKVLAKTLYREFFDRLSNCKQNLTYFLCDV